MKCQKNSQAYDHFFICHSSPGSTLLESNGFLRLWEGCGHHPTFFGNTIRNQIWRRIQQMALTNRVQSLAWIDAFFSHAFSFKPDVHFTVTWVTWTESVVLITFQQSRMCYDLESKPLVLLKNSLAAKSSTLGEPVTSWSMIPPFFIFKMDALPRKKYLC